MIFLDRRGFVLGGVATLVGASSGVAAGAGAQANPIAAIERRVGGRLGVFARELESGRTLSYRADERFLLASTFKALLAAMVLNRVDEARDALAAPVRYQASDLLPNSPVTRANAGHGVLSVGALCAAMTAVSDNTAANLLLSRCGGPAALTAFLRRIGDRTTRSDRYETALGERDGPLDTTSPSAVATTLAELLWGRALRPASRRRLADWLIANEVGGRRLRAGFPATWRAGDRTGTADGICNDVAFATTRGGHRLVIAAYHDAPGLALAAQERALRDVASAVAAWSTTLI